MATETSQSDLGSCDYLVIGAGAASLAFVDTTLIEQPEVKIVMVDKHPSPGGHWNDAYDFVHLHQPSLVYGVQSQQLEGNWGSLMLRGTVPWNHRASKKEILAYYKQVVDKWERTERLKFYGGCTYDVSQRERYFADGGIHCFSSGAQSYRVQVTVKLVNGTLGENIVPSKHPLEFPVSPGLQVITPNKLFEEYQMGDAQAQTGRRGLCCASGHVYPADGKQYVVLGAGKTGMDAVIFLQSVMHVPPEKITWVISADVWMMNRSTADPSAFARALVKSGGNREKACDDLEAQGTFVRLHPDHRPTRFRFPLIDKQELELLRRPGTVVRRGRVSSISVDDGKGKISICFGDGMEPLELLADPRNYVFVHCASPGPYNGKKNDDLFVSSTEMNLAMLDLPPVTISMAMLAKLESARRKGTLALEFGRRLVQASGISLKDSSDDELLRPFMQGYAPGPDDTRPLRNVALFIALLNADPKVGLKWLKGNRLCMLSVPGKKAGVYEILTEMIAKQKDLGYSASVSSILSPLQEQLKPIEGQ